MPATLQLQRSTPENEGISPPAIADFIATAEKNIRHLHSFMLLRHAKVVAEGWWYPWRPDAPHTLYSLSKSFTSSAIGLCVSEGRLSVEDQVIAFFPAETPRRASEHLQAMKVRHLLSMSTGHDQDTTERVVPNRDPFKAFLSLPVEHAPGTHFAYNSAASFILAAIVQRLTGQTLVEYLTPRLFAPLGIVEPVWESHPNGVNLGGWGLSLKTEDIARFGQLYLQKGKWEGKQILPEAWVDEATSWQVSNGDDPENDWTQGYGYQFWRCRHQCFRGDGAFGQFCIVMPELQAVMAITAGVPDMQPVLNMVWDKLLPAMGESRLSTANAATQYEPCNRKDLIIAAPRGASTSSFAEQFSGRTYTFEPNYETLRTLRFDFGKTTCSMTYRLLGGGKRRGRHCLTIGYGTWMEGTSFLDRPTPQRAAASGVWTSEDIFTITVCLFETPFVITIQCRFEGDRLVYNCVANVDFGPVERTQLVGLTESYQPA